MAPELISQVQMPPVLVGKAKTKPVAYRGPEELVLRLDRAAKALGLSRNEAMTQLLKFALDEHERKPAPKARK